MYAQPNAYLANSSHLVDSVGFSLLQLHIIVITKRFLISNSEWSRPINGRGAHVCSDVVFDFLLLRCRIVQKLQHGWQLFVFTIHSQDINEVGAAINVKKLKGQDKWANGAHWGELFSIHHSCACSRLWVRVYSCARESVGMAACIRARVCVSVHPSILFPLPFLYLLNF